MLFPGFGALAPDPLAEMRRLQNEVNRVFAGYGAAAPFPPVNLWLGEDSVVVTAELPGYAPEDVELTVRENVLGLAGQRQPETQGRDGATVHRRERVQQPFSRVVELPFRVDPERVQARFNNGILEVELHRPEADRPRRIQVRAS